ALWDVETGMELTRVPGVGGMAFEPNGALWVVENGAVARWPLATRKGKADHSQLEYEPPTRVFVREAFANKLKYSDLTLSRDGRFLAAMDRDLNCAWLIRTDRCELVRQ